MKGGTLFIVVLRVLSSLHTLAQHVRLVLDFMKSVDINLPILLRAISWNILELVSDLNTSAERMALMVSDELPGILAPTLETQFWHPYQGGL